MMAKERAARKRVAAYRRGKSAEILAAWLLQAKGYRILERNWRSALGEIDIIAARGSLIAAVEVKRREKADDALEAIRAAQRSRIERALLHYLRYHPSLGAMQIRFDAIIVQAWRLPRHVPDAWRPK